MALACCGVDALIIAFIVPFFLSCLTVSRSICLRSSLMPLDELLAAEESEQRGLRRQVSPPLTLEALY